MFKKIVMFAVIFLLSSSFSAAQFTTPDMATLTPEMISYRLIQGEKTDEELKRIQSEIKSNQNKYEVQQTSIQGSIAYIKSTVRDLKKDMENLKYWILFAVFGGSATGAGAGKMVNKVLGKKGV